MAMRNMHIRVNGEEYEFICALAGRLSCSQAEVIRRVLFDGSMKEVVREYREEKKQERMRDRMACMWDYRTEKAMQKLGEELNRNTQQIRRIGTNVSALIRDMRNGSVWCRDGAQKAVLERLEAVRKENESAMGAQSVLAGKLAQALDEMEVIVYEKSDPWEF